MTDLIRCPTCSESVKPAAILCRFCQRGLSERHFKKCRNCGEMVRLAARKCRFCSAAISDPPTPERPSDGSRVPRPSSDPPGARDIALRLPEPEKELEIPQPGSIEHPDKH
jgi:hypothetical protein